MIYYLIIDIPHNRSIDDMAYSMNIVQHYVDIYKHRGFRVQRRRILDKDLSNYILIEEKGVQND